MNRLPLLALALAAAALIAGCGDDEDSGDATTTAAPSTAATETAATEPPTTTATAPPPKPKKPQAGQPVPPGPGAIKIPNLVGSKLGDAQKELEGLGLAGRAESASGLRAEIKPDWEVCETSPAPGRKAPQGATVILISDKPGGC